MMHNLVWVQTGKGKYVTELITTKIQLDRHRQTDHMGQ